MLHVLLICGVAVLLIHSADATIEAAVISPLSLILFALGICESTINVGMNEIEVLSYIIFVFDVRLYNYRIEIKHLIISNRV